MSAIPSVGIAPAEPDDVNGVFAADPPVSTRGTRGLVHLARLSPVGTISAVILMVFALVGVFAPVLAPFDPLAGNYAMTRHAPSIPFILGTDDLGRDVLSRIIYGTRVTMLVSVLSVLVGDAIAFAWGVSSGYVAGRFDLISQRIIEVLMSFPTLILAMLLLIGLGAGVRTVILAIAITQVPGCTRIVRSSPSRFAVWPTSRPPGAWELRHVVSSSGTLLPTVSRLFWSY